MSRDGEGGFTLIELLVVVAITGVIATTLTGAAILGLRTTVSTENRVSGTSALQALDAYYYGDVQSAELVSTTPASTTDADCAPVTSPQGGVVLHLTWTERATSTGIAGNPIDVFYTLDPATGTDQVLARVRCSGSTGAPVTTYLGRFGHDPSVTPLTPLCDGGPCGPPASPAVVTMVVRVDASTPVVDLTADRRRALGS